jgi:uncharacterized protein (TIGR00730 family)
LSEQYNDVWRVFKIIGEFVEGFEKLKNVQGITVFGSARVNEKDKSYQDAVEIGKEIAKAGYDTITGGGPGIMEAASRGAKEGGGKTIGLNIELPKEQENSYLDLKINFHYFFARKTMFKKYSCGTIVCPGGFGTMDELLEFLTLIQTRKTKWTPVVLFNSKFWNPVLDFFKKVMLPNGFINKDDLNLMKLSDDPREAVQMITEVLKKDKDARKTLVDLEE